MTPARVSVFMYQVAFGDCFLISLEYARPLPDGRCARNILIDFGSSSPRPRFIPDFSFARIAELIREHCGQRLDVIAVTHRHKDHVLGFGDRKAAAIIESLSPDLVLCPWTQDPRLRPPAPEGRAPSPVQRAVRNLDEIASRGRGVYLRRGDLCSIERYVPGVRAHVFGPPASTEGPTTAHLSLNNTSLILLWEVGQGTSRKLLLFPGDAQTESWSCAMQSRKLLGLLPKINLYKVSHHGSATGNPDFLLSRLPLNRDRHMTALLSCQAGFYGRAPFWVPYDPLVKRLRLNAALSSTQDLGHGRWFIQVSAPVSDGAAFAQVVGPARAFGKEALGGKNHVARRQR